MGYSFRVTFSDSFLIMVIKTWILSRILFPQSMLLSLPEKKQNF
uniref:Uncharacterized protein n=1 Tax=Leptospirillum sp. Group II '5-way CG' TaxID=419541 RepID=B6AMW9_9BACT|nr:MAG: Hypothetical protein CGL2_11386019 [Leptospirillum sp. Group II '5-way CG']